MSDQHFDVIVVGGGHAGTEAAASSARMGARTLLLTHNIDTIGQMSCNPAIGGIGKTHLTKEIDALDGIMAKAIDRAAIHIRVLNERKGPAVQATRMQADRALYKQAVLELLQNQENLSFFQQAVDDLLIENGRVVGVATAMGVRFYAKSVVLTVGTFLAGKIHVGLKQSTGGRAGDPSATRLSEFLRSLSLPVGRLKTGTPPRLDARTIDFSELQAQPSEKPDIMMSYFDESPCSHPEQRHCYITHTNVKTHDIIRGALSESPMYTGVIEGSGPRYCPSIEDKIIRFSGRDSHQVFLEPEGLHTHEVYPNGVSTSLSYEAQVAFIHSMKGLEKAAIMRPGYAIEYDFFDPRALSPTLAVPDVPGLFFAGQINGTTGYEEAGAQGVLAGINAALSTQDRDLWIPTRDTSYIGVLVDDLSTQGTQEPYRMFTSRAEFRLELRQDNADWRLTEIGYKLGCVSEARYNYVMKMKERVGKAQDWLKSTHVHPSKESGKRFSELLSPLRESQSAESLLRRPEVDVQQLMECFPDNIMSSELTKRDCEQINNQARYAGYLDRQQSVVDKLKEHESAVLPADFDYVGVRGLSNEMIEKLSTVRPHTLGQASRIPGVTPAAVQLLMIRLKRVQR